MHIHDFYNLAVRQLTHVRMMSFMHVRGCVDLRCVLTGSIEFLIYRCATSAYD